MPFLLPAFAWWALGGAAIGAGATYVVSDATKNLVTIAAVGGIAYLLIKNK